MASIAELKETLKGETGLTITRAEPVSGGDICQAYRLESADGRQFFLKTHDGHLAAEMFMAEAGGLRAMAEVIKKHIPEVIAVGTEGRVKYLLLEYLPPARGNPDWQRLGEVLATLHASHDKAFGFDGDNFIGSLPQENTRCDNWVDFYREERIGQQISLAERNGLLAPDEVDRLEALSSRFQSLLGHEPVPSLLHGDLWSGNAYFANDGPYLIDPATYYGDREVDIAMTQLFGGFSSGFYEAYHATYPLEFGYEERLPLYQLYYLLVHVNLFGRSYWPRVATILKRYA